MARPKQCACKGIRSCLLCDGCETLTTTKDLTPQHSDTWFYCIQCQNRAFTSIVNHESHVQEDNYITIEGIFVQPEFLSRDEETQIIDDIDRISWVDSQSGRRKQDFGPKVNFKKKKIRLNGFTGFPSCSKLILDRMRSVDILSDFLPVEMCNLEYVPSRGSAIDPHFDDFWLWGERLVTINLLSDTSYTLSQQDSAIQVVVPLPSRSIAVLYGDARYKWMHSVKRHSILSRRIGITIRELAAEFLEGGQSYVIGRELIETAKLTAIIDDSTKVS